MKRNIFLRGFALLLCGTFLLTTTGCSDSGTGEVISYSLTANPKNLDPQTATGTDALLLVDNIFEGLYKKDADGNLVLGAAESCEKSDDGLEYRFTLPSDVRWKYYTTDNKTSGDQEITANVTANDFVYAFTRLFDPNTNAPSASNYYCIKNAQAVKEGKLPSSELGVTAENDTTLVFTLSSANPLFEQLLAEPPAKPCNQQFFEQTTGRYGLSREAILTNGPFYVSEWSNDSENTYVRIRQNNFYHDLDSVFAAGANLTVRTTDDAITAFTKGDIDSVSVNASDYGRIKGSKYPTTTYQNTVVGILLNPKEEHFSNDNIRKALALDMNREDFSATLTQDQLLADAIVPPSIHLGDASYREQVGTGLAPNYDPDQARSLFNQGTAQLQKANKNLAAFNTLTMLVPEEAAAPAQKILQLWQKDLGIYLKTEILPQDEYLKRLSSGDFSCAVIQVSSVEDNPSSILNQFCTDTSGDYSCSDPAYDKLLNAVAEQTQISGQADIYRQAEELLLDSGLFLPIYYQQNYFLTQSNIENLLFDAPSGRLYFQYTLKK